MKRLETMYKKCAQLLQNYFNVTCTVLLLHAKNVDLLGVWSCHTLRGKMEDFFPLLVAVLNVLTLILLFPTTQELIHVLILVHFMFLVTMLYPKTRYNLCLFLSWKAMPNYFYDHTVNCWKIISGWHVWEIPDNSTILYLMIPDSV